MMLRILMVLGLVTLGAKGALACSFVPRTLDQSFDMAKTAFVGTVRTVENDLAIFHVEKAIRGVKEGEDFQTDVHADKGTCGLNFQPGQRWLYLGNMAPDGSQLLQDEMGRPNKDAIDDVKPKLGDIGPYSGDIIGGTIAAACGTKKGDAFGINLDNGISVSVDASLNDLDKKDMNSVAGYASGASIVQCPRPKDGKPEDLPCRSVKGAVSIGFVTADDATGQVKIEEGEYHSLYVFHVQRSKTAVVCGGSRK